MVRVGPTRLLSSLSLFSRTPLDLIMEHLVLYAMSSQVPTDGCMYAGEGYSDGAIVQVGVKYIQCSKGKWNEIQATQQITPQPPPAPAPAHHYVLPE